MRKFKEIAGYFVRYLKMLLLYRDGDFHSCFNFRLNFQEIK